MRNLLMATTALALTGGLAVAPASAADKMSVGVGGFMQQWIGMADVDATKKGGVADPSVEGGVGQYPDTEVIVNGKLEADNGLTFTVKVEIEGDGAGIDESRMGISGAFGKIEIGSEDGASTLTHHGNRDVGVALNCGDITSWISGITGCARANKLSLGTAGHVIDGDKNKVSYFTPRMSGVQIGMSYAPNQGQEGGLTAPKNNDTDAWSIGGNFKGEFGGGNIAISAGHFQASQVLPAKVEKSVKGTYMDDDGMSRSVTHKAMIDNPVTKIDDRTFTNFGLQVDMAGVGFDVAYAEHDGGQYKADGMKDTSKDYEVVSAGVNYSDGPMAVSLGHMMAEADDGSEVNQTMLSLAYTLAPGVTSKTSLFAAEQNNADKSSVEGTAFVTGIVIGF